MFHLGQPVRYSRACMTDVSAIVLSVGERYTERALASLARQTVPPADVVMVTGEIRPFHRAINAAAERVNTPFFLQVDADMVLDPGCLEEIRAAVRDDAGMVIGQLRDPLLGPILGVRLYRSRCFRDLRVPDSISPMSDFEAAMQRSGWSMLCAIRRPNGRATTHNLFGEHLPDYNPRYTFAKFLLSGARNRYRGSDDRLRTVFARLRISTHPAAGLAQIAAAHGIFRRDRTDQLGHSGGEEFDRLSEFLQSSGVAPAAIEPVAAAVRSNDLRKAFGVSIAAGIELLRRHARPTFWACMRELASGGGEAAWVASIGLCHGLFVDRYADERVAEDFAWLEPLLRLP